MTNQIMTFKSEVDLAGFLNKNYLVQIKNFFNDESKALKFLSGVRADVQRNPKLLDCEPMSVVNSYMTMAQLGFMPSNVSGEAYVLPYNSNNKGMQAQFQLGYQGFVTLFYKAGVTSIFADIVRENDSIELNNGGIKHNIDPKKSMKERGNPIGAYVVINYKGQLMGKYMHGEDILAHGRKFSKSFDTDFSPWKESNDPEKWMWKKTVLKQASKLLPKNETINKAIALDNKDSIISDRLDEVKVESNKLKMKSNNEKENSKENKESTVESSEDSIPEGE